MQIHDSNLPLHCNGDCAPAGVDVRARGNPPARGSGDNSAPDGGGGEQGKTVNIFSFVIMVS